MKAAIAHGSFCAGRALRIECVWQAGGVCFDEGVRFTEHTLRVTVASHHGSSITSRKTGRGEFLDPIDVR